MREQVGRFLHELWALGRAVKRTRDAISEFNKALEPYGDEIELDELLLSENDIDRRDIGDA